MWKVWQFNIAGFFDTSCIKKCDKLISLQIVIIYYYKVRQVLRSITDFYYKVWQVLQIVTVIKKSDVTPKYFGILVDFLEKRRLNYLFTNMSWSFWIVNQLTGLHLSYDWTFNYWALTLRSVFDCYIE